MSYQAYGCRTPVWREMARLQRHMNRLSGDTSADLGPAVEHNYPPTQIWVNENATLLVAEVAGVKAEDIDIAIEGDKLTLSGKRVPEDRAEDNTYYRRERGHGQFSRAFKLPYPVEAEQVEATLDKGVLNIALPRAEADKPRKIAIQAA